MTTYKRIAAVELTVRLLNELANTKEPTGGQDLANAVDAKFGTVMCHLATLEDAGYVTRIGEKYQLGMKMALMWARVKSNLESKRDKINSDIESLSI
jgi:DNA-binding IclR family transcriptional regulator